MQSLCRVTPSELDSDTVLTADNVKFLSSIQADVSPRSQARLDGEDRPDLAATGRDPAQALPDFSERFHRAGPVQNAGRPGI